MKILLTGGTGQVGHALTRTLQGQGEIYAPDRSQFDLSNSVQIAEVIRNFCPDMIINPAAYTAVDKAESEPELAMQINGIAPGIMAQEAKKLGIPLIHYSTDYVYDGSKQDADGNWLPYVETDATAPLSVYGKTKLAGEQAIRASACSHIIFRTSWVYSMFGKNFLLTMLRLAAEKDSLNIVNDQWGAPTWAHWIAVATNEIVTQAAAAGLKSGDWWQQHGGIYHLTSGGCTSWYGFASAIMHRLAQNQTLQKPVPSVSGIPTSAYPTPATRPHNSRLNTELIQHRFGLSIPDWEQSLEQCLSGA